MEMCRDLRIKYLAMEVGTDGHRVVCCATRSGFRKAAPRASRQMRTLSPPCMKQDYRRDAQGSTEPPTSPRHRCLCPSVTQLHHRSHHGDGCIHEDREDYQP